MKANRSLLDVFLEIQMLDRIPRAGFVLRGVAEPESVAEHSLHVLFLVWALGPKIEGIVVPRAVEIARIHGRAALPIGDVARTSSHYFPGGGHNAAAAGPLAGGRAPLGRH